MSVPGRAKPKFAADIANTTSLFLSSLFLRVVRCGSMYNCCGFIFGSFNEVQLFIMVMIVK